MCWWAPSLECLPQIQVLHQHRGSYARFASTPTCFKPMAKGLPEVMGTEEGLQYENQGKSLPATRSFSFTQDFCKCHSPKEKLQGRTVGTLRNFSLAWDGMGLSAKAIGHLEVVPGSMLPSAGEGTWSQAVERDMKRGRRCEMHICI